MWSEGPAGQAAWAETYGARALGLALTAQSEFWQHVDEVRADAEAAKRLARLYVRRDQGGRVAAVQEYIERAAAVDPGRDRAYQRAAVWQTGLRGWFVDAQLAPGQPVRNLRRDVIETLALGAYRVARRGAGRCAAPDCCVDPITGVWSGAKLASDRDADYCTACARVLRRPRELEEAERVLFDAVVPVVLGGPSRARARRSRRAA